MRRLLFGAVLGGIAVPLAQREELFGFWQQAKAEYGGGEQGRDDGWPQEWADRLRDRKRRRARFEAKVKGPIQDHFTCVVPCTDCSESFEWKSLGSTLRMVSALRGKQRPLDSAHADVEVCYECTSPWTVRYFGEGSERTESGKRERGKPLIQITALHPMLDAAILIVRPGEELGSDERADLVLDWLQEIQNECQGDAGGLRRPLVEGNGRSSPAWSWPSSSSSNQANRSVKDVTKELESMGAHVYFPEEPGASAKGAARWEVDWGLLAGYEKQKEELEDTLLVAGQERERAKQVAEKTRGVKGVEAPKAILLEGPPGCGKTAAARAMSKHHGLAMVHVPVEKLCSMYHGKTENNMSRLLELTGELGSAMEPEGACIVFLDELDSLFTGREGNDIHEARRAALGSLLRALEGLEGLSQGRVIMGATNRQSDLDAALLSRFEAVVTFSLPDEPTRKEIWRSYAQHLQDQELDQLAKASEGFSGRDIRDSSLQAERKWIAKAARSRSPAGNDSQELSPPPLSAYLSAASTLTSSSADQIP